MIHYRNMDGFDITPVKSLTVDQSLNVVVSAITSAQSNGVYTLRDSSMIHTALQNILQYYKIQLAKEQASQQQGVQTNLEPPITRSSEAKDV